MSDGKYWTHARNWVIGCKPAGPECRQCWAAATIHRFGLGSASLTVETIDGVRWSGAVEERDAQALPVHGAPQVIAINWLGDLGYEGVSDEQCADVLDRLLINSRARRRAGAEPHAYLMLTHRPARLVDRAFRWLLQMQRQLISADYWLFFTADDWLFFTSSIWWGATVTRQDQLEDARLLSRLPGWYWLSAEPLVEPIMLGESRGLWSWITAGTSTTDPALQTPLHLSYLTALAGECVAGDLPPIPIWIKQMGKVTVPPVYRKRPATIEQVMEARARSRRAP